MYDIIAILTKHVNENGKVDDAKICVEIAQFINAQPLLNGNHYVLWNEVYDFIYEYGEDVDSHVVGRDEEGEKVYVTHNPDTNWYERIMVELVKLGYYARWEATQKVV
jgi:hypothetical protein